VIPLIRDTVKSWVPEICAREVGSVLTVADGIAYVDGLANATYGEILLFEGGIRGMVQELRGERIGCILFGRVEEVSEGTVKSRINRAKARLRELLSDAGNLSAAASVLQAETVERREQP